jgi:hypothetical protein
MKSINRLTCLTAASSLLALSAAAVSPIWAASLEVTEDGVGIGTATPTAEFDVRSTKTNPVGPDFKLVTNQPQASFNFSTTGPNPNAAAFNFNGSTFSPDGLLAINIEEPGGGLGSPAEFRLFGTGNLTVTGTVNSGSSVTAKDNISAIDVHQVLASVADLPISKWSYKTEDEVAHIGPMAEDFHAAFSVGSDEKHISMVDSDGVALASIQALHQNQEGWANQIAALEQEFAEKGQRLQRLQQLAEEQREAIHALQARLDALESNESRGE